MKKLAVKLIIIVKLMRKEIEEETKDNQEKNDN